MPSTPNIAIAVAAGVIILGGAAYLEKDKLGLSFGGIHSVDFRNAPVEVVGTACADPQLTTAGVTRLPLHDGAYQLGQYQFELVGDVRYGDVSGHTGDSNSEKAVFVGSCSTAGKTSQVLFVYGMMDGKPERLAFNDLSATANTLVQSYSVGDGAIQVKANQGDPPALVTLTYALLNGNLVNLNPAAAPQPAQAPSDQVAQTPTDVQAASNESVDSTSATTGDDKIDFATFHDSLAPYGEWIRHPTWGLVWHPTQVSANFRPYRDGHWEDNDEYGTVWVSDYSWGDIPFHYGRWGYDPNRGWLWQPGYVWSPAWVVWREGAGNIGWLPIPPGYYDGTSAFVDDWDGWYGYRELYGAALDETAFDAMWSFVPADDIYAPSIAVDVIAPLGYAAFIGRTVGWTRFGLSRGHLVNRAIDRDRFRAAFGHQRPVGTRHDFLAHHGPIVGPARGRAIAAHERIAGHVGVGIGVHHAGLNHFGPGVHHASFGHSSSHSGFGPLASTGKQCPKGCSPAHRSGFGGSAAHSGFGAQHSSFAQHSGFGASQHSGFAQHSGFGASQHSGFGGGQQASFGGGTQHSSFGGGQRPAFGGGAQQQRPAFSAGGTPARPNFNGGGFSRPAPQVQRPTSNNNHHH